MTSEAWSDYWWEHDLLIFEPFFTAEKKEGTGLGLYAVRQLLESLNGTIYCESSPGRTKFIITLPVLPDSSTHSPMNPSIKVAVIDDNIYVLQSWMDELAAFEIHTFSTVEAAQDYFRAKGWPFDVTIVDLHMNDGQSGLELSQTLRQKSSSRWFLSTNESLDDVPEWITPVGKDPQPLSDLLAINDAA